MDCDVSALPPTCPSLARLAMRRSAAEHCFLAESDTTSKGEKEESREMDRVLSSEGDLSCTDPAANNAWHSADLLESVK